MKTNLTSSNRMGQDGTTNTVYHKYLGKEILIVFKPQRRANHSCLLKSFTLNKTQNLTRIGPKSHIFVNLDPKKNMTHFLMLYHGLVDTIKLHYF